MTHCIRCRQELDKHGEHLLPCRYSTNPEFRKQGVNRTPEDPKILRSYRFPTVLITGDRDRFEAIREAA